MDFRELIDVPDGEWPDAEMRAILGSQSELMDRKLFSLLTDEHAPFLNGWILKRIEYMNPGDSMYLKPNVAIDMTWPGKADLQLVFAQVDSITFRSPEHYSDYAGFLEEVSRMYHFVWNGLGHTIIKYASGLCVYIDAFGLETIVKDPDTL